MWLCHLCINLYFSIDIENGKYLVIHYTVLGKTYKTHLTYYYKISNAFQSVINRYMARNIRYISFTSTDVMHIF